MTHRARAGGAGGARHQGAGHAPSRSPRFDAAIIGAGPAGSAAAILLARAGWSVALIEKRAFPRRKVCGECVAASNLSLLAALGIGPAFAAAAGPELRRVALMRGERTLIADLPAATDGHHRWGRALGRETLDSLLRDAARAAGASVLQPATVRSIGGQPGDWQLALDATADAQLSDQSGAACLQATVLIDAHGSWEQLPAPRTGRRTQRRASDLLAFKANFSGARLEPGLLPVLSFPGGYGGMVVADDGITTVACCIRRDRLEDLRRRQPARVAGELVEAMLRASCAGVRQALDGATRCGDWLAVGPLAVTIGNRCAADDGILRIGNAAGEVHPIIGEGMSIALQSAFLLCARLLTPEGEQSPAPPAGRRFAAPPDAARQRTIGSHYAVAWRRHFTTRMRLAAVFAHLAMRPTLAAPLLALPGLWPGLLTLGARLAGKTRCAVDQFETFDFDRLANFRSLFSFHPPHHRGIDMTNTADRLRDILARDYKLDASALTPATPLEELGIDSLGLAELLFTIEDEFGISLASIHSAAPGGPRLATVGDIVHCVDEAIAAGPTAAIAPGSA